MREKRANTSKIRGQEQQLDVAGLMNLLPLFHSTVLGLSVFSVQVKKFGPQKRGMVFFLFSKRERWRIWGLVTPPEGPGLCVCVSENIARATGDTLRQRLPQVESVNQNLNYAVD